MAIVKFKLLQSVKCLSSFHSKKKKESIPSSPYLIEVGVDVLGWDFLFGVFVVGFGF